MTDLRAANMIDTSGKIVPAPADLDKKLSNEIYSRIDYVCQYEDCIRIRRQFPELMSELETKSRADWEKSSSSSPYPGLRHWEIVRRVTDYLGVQSTYGIYREESAPPYISYYANTGKGPTSLFPLDIRGYDMISQISGEETSSAEGST